MDIKIGLKYSFLSSKTMIKAFHFKVPKSQTEEAKQIVRLVKTHYLLANEL